MRYYKEEMELDVYANGELTQTFYDMLPSSVYLLYIELKNTFDDAVFERQQYKSRGDR